MKPAPFDYESPVTLDDALALLDRPGACPLAGGQSLIPNLSMRRTRPDLLVDLRRVPDLRSIETNAGTLRIGPMVTFAEAAASPEVRDACPLVIEAIRHVGSPAIRNRGTLAGNLVWADPASELPLVAVALGAVLTLRRRDGEREVAAADFLLGAFECAIRPGEIVTSIRFPVAGPGARASFAEVSPRRNAPALAAVAAQIEVVDGKVRAARIVVGGVHPVPLRLTAVEVALEDAGPGTDLPDLGASVAKRAVGSLPDAADYASAVVPPLVGRTIASILAAS
ncbi:molybdopterin dehydrogenase [Skermanella stibiiresistens SB22]|uniref:Molybdopterin dehydrogenase n=1 Tax=Skermanella stibiiresistens SB22 TaxID=1385369 RepID=W9H3T3_9PROT|nr:FAD binding domain-containing protein [Skermanella stibiiresistens]EWY38428.1 molybdopterin dehydrogenase [Skermanella stibiiresistens SB22]